MHASTGVIYVALGTNAGKEMKESRATLPENLKVHCFNQIDKSSNLTVVQQAHWAKTRAASLTPFRYTLLLDADTRVVDKEAFMLGFRLVEQGFDLIMIPSWPPTIDKLLWSLDVKDRAYTLDKLGYFRHIMLNTGVMYFNSTSERVKELFKQWEKEWLRFKNRDQGAFLRALQVNPVKMFLLGRPFNSSGGVVIEHLFGKAV